MKILSIIIPSYNTSKYIDDCIPTYLVDDCLEDLEILIIDDGSNDDTYEKAKQYEKKYSDVIRVIHKENGGHGSAINRGIIEATGKYFKVIDGDDWVVSNNLSEYIDFIKSSNADVILNPHIIYNIKNNKETLCDETHAPYNVSVLIDSIYKYINVGIHNVTYLTSLLKENKIKFQENCFYEDQQYDVFPMAYANTVSFYKKPIYVYRVGTDNQSINTKVFIKNRKMSEEIMESLICFANNLPEHVTAKRKDYFMMDISRRVNKRCSFYLKLPYGNKSKTELHEFYEELKTKSPELYNYPTNFPIKLLRLDKWITYTVLYFLFLLKRKIRGF